MAYSMSRITAGVAIVATSVSLAACGSTATTKPQGSPAAPVTQTAPSRTSELPPVGEMEAFIKKDVQKQIDRDGVVDATVTSVRLVVNDTDARGYVEIRDNTYDQVIRRSVVVTPGRGGLYLYEMAAE